MSDDDKRRLRDEVADLTDAIDDLREQIKRNAEHHHCCPQPAVWIYPPACPVPVYTPPAWPGVITTPQYVVTCGGTTSTALPGVTVT